MEWLAIQIFFPTKCNWEAEEMNKNRKEQRIGFFQLKPENVMTKRVGFFFQLNIGYVLSIPDASKSGYPEILQYLSPNVLKELIFLFRGLWKSCLVIGVLSLCSHVTLYDGWLSIFVLKILLKNAPMENISVFELKDTGYHLFYLLTQRGKYMNSCYCW